MASNKKANQKANPTKSKLNQTSNSSGESSSMLFGKKNYLLILAGFGLMALGFLLMAGGNMPSPDVWDESLIYSTRRTLIAPIFILAGLGVQVYAIFKK